MKCLYTHCYLCDWERWFTDQGWCTCPQGLCHSYPSQETGTRIECCSQSECCPRKNRYSDNDSRSRKTSCHSANSQISSHSSYERTPSHGNESILSPHRYSSNCPLLHEKEGVVLIFQYRVRSVFPPSVCKKKVSIPHWFLSSSHS